MKATSSFPRPPREYPRRVLLAVTGLSPQVVTETVYALSRGDMPFVPTEVHVLTTAEGAERVRLALLSEEPGWFHRLCRDYELPPVAFDERHVHVLRDGQGRELDDIRTPEDNCCAADAITERVRAFTADPECALHVSIAGGRKTMGYYAGYALSLFARPQDRLSHVLVAEPFESSWEFFYPTPYRRVITTRDNKLIDTAEAEVSLAEIPFVSLRHGLDEDLLRGWAGFSDVVAGAQRSLQPPQLVLDLEGRRIRAGGRVIPLPPRELAFYTLFARRRMKGAPPLPAPPKGFPDRDWGKCFLAEYKNIRVTNPYGMDNIDRTEEAYEKGMTGDQFSEIKSRLHRSLQKALGKAAAMPYLIDDGGKRPRRYALTLPAEAVRFAPVEEEA